MNTSLRHTVMSVALAGAALLLPTTAWAGCESSAATEPSTRARANATAVANILNDASAALARGDFGEACVKYRLVLSVDRGNSAALLGLGEGALGEGDAEAARAHFEAVAAAAPDTAAAYQGIGLAYLIGGHFAEAEAQLRRSVEMDAALWRSWNGIGVIADGRRDWQAADAAWEAATLAAPNEPSLYNNIGMSLIQRGQPADALRAFDLALRMKPDLTTAANNRRIALAMTREYDAALAGVSERELPSALNNIAVVAARNGDRAVAERLFAAAITASPRYYELAVRNRESVAR